MRIGRKDGRQTARRLLIAAADVFANKAYRCATISEICHLAGVNVAAINYHFQDKETLYAEAWRYAFSESLKSFPPDGGIPADAAPEERLEGQIRSFLQRITDENNKEFWIGQKELASPTGLLREVMSRSIAPLIETMGQVIRELLGPYEAESRVYFAVLSIISQCSGPMAVRKHHMAAGEQDSGRAYFQNIDEYIEHVVRFSLGALHAFGKAAET
jgi:TetR/AcrR family transcriptional regulator, regulator of cefoperazone and chloramphenicol sensitivity